MRFIFISQSALHYHATDVQLGYSYTLGAIAAARLSGHWTLDGRPVFKPLLASVDRNNAVTK